MTIAARRHKAWLGLGGNIGQVETRFRYALRRLTEGGRCRLLAVSSLYCSKAWGRENQPDFLNACVALDTDLSPHALLRLCLRTEKEQKRQRAEKWGPRSLDIDILMYENYENNDGGKQNLILPHPFLAERAFTVLPLAEICPNLPLNGISFGERAEIMQKKEQGGKIKIIEKSNNWYKI